jgi:hypothetical protein
MIEPTAPVSIVRRIAAVSLRWGRFQRTGKDKLMTATVAAHVATLMMLFRERSPHAHIWQRTEHPANEYGIS